MVSTKANDRDYPLHERIKEPTENDVLFGRGVGISNYQGNIRFRKIVQDLLQDYTSANKRGMKTELAKSVVAAIKDRQGRFLRKVTKARSGNNSQESECYWVQVEDMELIMDKVRQTFRDMACTARQVKGQSNNNYLIENKASHSHQFKSAVQKAQQKNTPKDLPSKGIGHANKTTLCAMVRTSTSTSDGNQNYGQMVRDRSTTAMGRVRLQSDSATASELALLAAVNPLKQDFDHSFSTLSGTVPVVLVHQLEEARARVNQERQKLLLRNLIEIQSAINVARLRQALVLPSLEIQIMQGLYRGYQVSLQRNPQFTVARSQEVNNPSFLDQVRAFSNPTTHSRSKLSQP